MTEVQKISIKDNKIIIKIEKDNIAILINNQLRCSGFKDSIDYLLYHCYFNDIPDRQAFLILETYQEYYAREILHMNHKDQELMTEYLFCLHEIITSCKYRMKFFRKLHKDPQFRHNYTFWRLVFDTYFDSGKVGRFASRILLRNNPYRPELWTLLSEIENDINYRKAVIKRILHDIQRNQGEIR